MPDRDLLVDEVGPWRPARLVWTARSRISRSRRVIAEMLARGLPTAPRASVGFRELGEAPQRAAAAGLPRTRLTNKWSSHDRMEVGLSMVSAD